MAIHTRLLTDEERSSLVALCTGNNGHSSLVRRARIVLMSDDGWYVPQIARKVGQHPQTVRAVIRRFNERGLQGLAAQARRGRRARLSPDQQRAILALVLAEPRSLGLPFPTWTLATLRDEAIRRGIVPRVGRETLRRVLLGCGIYFSPHQSWRQIDQDML